MQRKIGIALFAAVTLVGCDKSGRVQDEAMRAGRPPESFPAAGDDYFRAMDNGASFTPVEVKGRSMWIVWTGGNDRFWDTMTNDTFGAFDLLKTLSSYPGLKFGRDNRWNYLGLANEPCLKRPAARTRTVTASGSTTGAPTVRPGLIRSKTRQNIRA